MKKRTIILFIILGLVLYVVLGALLPSISHREVTEDYKKIIEGVTYTDESISASVDYIDDNVDALIYRIKMAEAAKKEIIVTTFAFHADDAGKEVMATLLEAADRGVKVKIIADGMNAVIQIYRDAYFAALAVHDNIEIKIYNPISAIKPWRAQYRMHDKYFIVDREMYLLGGRNTNNIFLGDYGESGNTDSEVFVQDTVSVAQLVDYFDDIWSIDECKTLKKKNKKRVKTAANDLHEIYKELPGRYPEAFRESDHFMKGTYNANKVSLLSNSYDVKKKMPDLWYALCEVMKQGKDIIIHTPYIIMNDAMKSEMKKVCEQSDRVDIIINAVASGANPWGCTDYLNDKDNILRTGATIYEYLGDQSMHSKNVVIDDRLSIVGSFNFDMRSTYLNTELMVVIDSEELNKELRLRAGDDKEFCRSSSEGTEYEYGGQYVEREIKGMKKVLYSFLRIVIRPFRHVL